MEEVASVTKLAITSALELIADFLVWLSYFAFFDVSSTFMNKITPVSKFALSFSAELIADFSLHLIVFR